jgi:hypothetical protein
MKKFLLIIGRKPLPIGGVTVHVDRLCNSLIDKNIDFHFIDPTKLNICRLLIKIIQYKIIHVHVSNPLLLLFIVFWSKLVKTLCIFTLHGNFARYKGLKKAALYLAIKISDVPIILNQESYEIVKKIKTSARFINSFIPPLTEELLDGKISSEIQNRSLNKNKIIITSAGDVAFDFQEKETYGISTLIEYFWNKDCLLIVSDPSGNYEKFIKNKYSLKFLDNVFFISIPHSFYSALSFADVYIRNTTTDGDSLSIHEALYLGKIVWATDCVTRPLGTYIYKNLDEIQFDKKQMIKYIPPLVVDQLILLYYDLVNGIINKNK